MSVLIQGMEMPKEMRTLTIFPNGYVAVYNSFDTFISETKAIQIPPHGRLIDADDIVEKYGEPIMDHTGRTEWTVRVDRIQSAPTIIPADKEEING